MKSKVLQGLLTQINNDFSNFKKTKSETRRTLNYIASRHSLLEQSMDRANKVYEEFLCCIGEKEEN